MSTYSVKVYVVQTAAGSLLTVKLTRAAAQAVAKANAPAKVTFVMADKMPTLEDPLLTLD